MDIKLLDELERLWRKTQPKDWFVETRDANGNGNPINTLDDEYCKIHRSAGAHAETVASDFEADDGSPDVAELVCLLVNHAPALIAAAKRAEQAEAEVGRLMEAYKRCKVCERTVDTREQTDGGDPHGGQLESGEWVCSRDCYEETLTPPPTANAGATA